MNRRDRVKTSRSLAFVLAGLVTLAACGGDGGQDAEREPEVPEPSPTETAAGTGDDGGPLFIAAKAIAFTKDSLTIPAGDTTTITFENRDPKVSHSFQVSAAGSEFTTGVFEGPATETVEIAIAERGTYRFFCEVHPSVMEGELVVE